MEFKNFVCWDPVGVDRVMDTEALQPVEPVFLAVHHPVKMVRTTYAGLYQGRSEQAAVYAERQFLEDLLRHEDFAFVPVIGKSGSGKSHLVRWLALTMPETPNRHVLLIPKVDTNLWDVLNRILDLPGVKGNGAFDDYRSALRKVRSELRSEEHAREELLNKLSLACGVNGPHKMMGLTAIQHDLALNLPNLLYDPFFREILLAPNGVIDRLVKHTIGESSVVERLEERKQFKREDLPLKASHVKKASAKAQAFYGQLTGLELLQQEAVEWLNRHLNTAITELLDFSGDALLRLFLKVRAALAEVGVELVLLIEDFQKCQGIELQLIEAIIAKPHQEGHARLCPLRTVLACNRGYFDQLPETVRTRADFYVTLDLEAAQKGEVIGPDEVEQFVARYLNATRLGEARLTTWYASAKAEEDRETSAAPSACAGCEHRDRCHAAFGARDGFGLYPFTSTVVERMGERVSPDGFNPRLVLKDMLKPVLTSYADALRDGRFPPPALADHFKGSTLSAAVKSELNRLDPNPETRGRRLVLLDLWTNGERVQDLEPGIHKAFSLPALGRTVPQGPPDSDLIAPPVRPGSSRTPAAEPTPPLTASELPARLTEQLRLLDAWSNGETLSQAIVNALRKPIFDSVQARINWDAELLVKGFFCGDGRPFKRTSVNFHRQGPQRMPALVQLTIPLDPTAPNAFTNAAIALQGLLLAAHHKSWNFRFENHPGSFYLRRYAEQLERWAAAVRSQLRKPHRDDTNWDPAPAAAELLALAARMAGRPIPSKTTTDTQLYTLFQSLEGVSIEHRSAAWKELFTSLREKQSALAEIVLSHAACTKGGSKIVQMLDSTRLVKMLIAIRKDYRPREEIPAEPWEPYGAVVKLREKVGTLLERSVEEERARLLAWRRDRVDSEIGPEEAQAKLIEGVRTAVDAAHQDLGFAGESYADLIASLEKLRYRQLGQCLESIEKLRAETDPGAILVELGRDQSEVTAAVDTFITLTTQFLDRYEPRVENDIAHFAGAGELKDTLAEIGTAFDDLNTLLGELRGGQT
jgi:hypothetical protein